MENSIIEISNELEFSTENIQNLIYTIRGKQVMLDSDVAMLYHYTTKRINETVRRNIERFPENFCFQLTESEVQNYGGRRYLPYVFTEQGIAMLSGLLKNEIAVRVSINIMNAFIEMRKFLISNSQIFERLTNVEYKLLENDKKFDKVFNELEKSKNEEFKQKIFFQGQIWDSYSLIVDIIKTLTLTVFMI